MSEIVGGIDYHGLLIAGRGMHDQGTGSNTIFMNLYLGYTFNSLGIYYLSGTGTLSAWHERIGYKGIGQFFQSGGSNTVQGLTLGFESGSQGTYELSGGQLSTGTLRVGRKGEGAFTHSAGTNTVDQTLTVGYAEGSQGTYDLRSDGNHHPELWARKQIIGDAGTGTFNNIAGKTG